MKKVYSIVLTLLTIFSCLVLFTSCEKTDIDINNYESKRQKIGNASDMMPSLTDLGKYSDIRYSHKNIEDLFVTDSISLFVKYSESEYETNKQKALENYDFINEPIINEDDWYLIPVSEIDYKGYHFKIVCDDEVRSACQSFLMIGFDDKNSKIAYCYIYDFDRDLISYSSEDSVEEMTNFIDYNFLWNDFNS